MLLGGERAKEIRRIIGDRRAGELGRIAIETMKTDLSSEGQEYEIAQELFGEGQ